MKLPYGGRRKAVRPSYVAAPGRRGGFLTPAAQRHIAREDRLVGETGTRSLVPARLPGGETIACLRPAGGQILKAADGR